MPNFNNWRKVKFYTNWEGLGNKLLGHEWSTAKENISMSEQLKVSFQLTEKQMVWVDSSYRRSLDITLSVYYGGNCDRRKHETKSSVGGHPWCKAGSACQFPSLIMLSF